MIQLQFINKILDSKDISLLDRYGITEDYFSDYVKEFRFIKKHYEKYNTVPDKATFVESFPDFEFTKVTESNQFLIDKLQENYVFLQAVPFMNKAVELFQEDSNEAIYYLRQQLYHIKEANQFGGIDIIHNANRVAEFQDKKQHKDEWFFKSGFDEIDEVTSGISRNEELIVLVARTNQGKSWILTKMALSVWAQGANIGYFSPEMTANSIGYRFDTLYKHLSNRSLMNGYNDIDDDSYNAYIEDLSKNEAKFIVSTPADFARKATVSKLRTWILQNDLKAIFIDGLSYLADERKSHGDNTTTTLTNISEDLMSLSVELKVPIVTVVQANREGAKDEELDLTHIRNSDGIGHNASKVITIAQKNGQVTLKIKKSRNSTVNDSFDYNWDINTGTFTFVKKKSDSDKTTTRHTHDEAEQQHLFDEIF